MPSTQAYNVDRTVEITPTGANSPVDLSDDIVDIVLREEEDNVNSAKVKVDTSERPYSIEESWDIFVEITDGNDTQTFDGFVDEVKDDEERPVVTIDAREPAGLLDDVSLVGTYSGDTVFDVIEGFMDGGPSQVRQISFDVQSLKNTYGSFDGSTVFGDVEVSYFAQFGVATESFTQQETLSDRGKQAELNIDYYENNTGSIYTLEITGKDGNGDEVFAVLDLPPAEDAQDAFGTTSVKLALQGGNQRFAEVNSITTDIPSLTGSAVVALSGTIENFVKTNWSWTAGDDNSVRDGIESVVSYISALDESRTWEYDVDGQTDELIIQPEQPNNPPTHVFRETDNVIRPVAKRSLDEVYNFVKVSGTGGVNAWTWAYNGRFRFSLDNPFTSGTNDYPGGIDYADSPSNGANDIDQINLRAVGLGSDQISDSFQALDVAKKALREFYRVPVTGTAPVSGVLDVTPGDKAEVYFPSRGIPQKVADNVYTVKAVEWRVEADEAKTEVDFGLKRPNTSDIVSSLTSGKSLRGDVSSDIRSLVQNENGVVGGGFRPVVGDIVEENSDGTFVVQTVDGETYDSVQVV